MRTIGTQLLSLILICSGAAANAQQSLQLNGQNAIRLTSLLVDIEALESDLTSEGYAISTGRFTCQIETENQSGDPWSKAEVIPVDANCQITQKFWAIDLQNNKKSNSLKEVTQTQEIGNALDIFNLLVKSGAKTRGNTITIKSLECEVVGEYQSGDAEAKAEFLPTSALCVIAQ